MQPHFRLLGPLEVVGAAGPVALGGPRPRRLLAVLLLHAGEVVDTDRLVEAVWDAPPASAEVTLRSHVAGLRRHLVAAGTGPVLVTCSRGYRLEVPGEQVDAVRFERLTAAGQAALARGDADGAARTLRDALALWRGGVLADLDRPAFAEAATARLDEVRLAALEARVEAELIGGRHAEVVGELDALTREHPFHERFRAQLVLALYRCHRQADALAAHRAGRRLLAEELGVEPGAELAGLEQAVLRHDPALRAPARTAAEATLPAAFDVIRRTPMVGRADDLRQLRALWATVRGGGRRVALVSGEAGVGKTRLVAELAAHAAAQGGAVLVGHGEQAALVPYQPVVEALEHHPDVPAALAAAPSPVRHALARVLGRSHAVPPPRDAAVSGPAEQHAALLHAVDDLLARATRRAPTLLVVEDAERVDRASARLLLHVGRHLPARMLLVVCFRDPPGSRHLPLLPLLAGLESGGLADRLALPPLTESDLAALVAACTGQEMSAGDVHALWSMTGGNAFLAREMVGQTAQDVGGRRAPGQPGEPGGVPPAVSDVLRARLAALPATVRDVVRCAAVLGREVDVGLLAAVAGLPAAAIVTATDEAAAAGLVAVAERSGTWRCTFRHRLVLNAVVDDIPAVTRQRLHLRAAEAMEARTGAGVAALAAVAVQLRAAGPLADPDRTARAALRAASAAASCYAFDEAVGHAEAAVDVLTSAGVPPGRLAVAELAAGDLLVRQSSDLGRGITHLDRALEHFRAAGDRLGAATAHGRLGHVLVLHHSVMDIAVAREHLAAARGVGLDLEAAVDTHWAASLADLFAVRTRPGLAAAQQAVDAARALGRPDLVAAVLPTLATHEMHTGALARGRAMLDEAWTTARELDNPNLTWEAVLSAGLAGNVYLLDPVDAESWCRRGLGGRRLEGVALAHEGVTDHLAYAVALQGRLPAARRIAAGLPAETLSRRLLLLLDGDAEAAEAAWAEAMEHDLDHGDVLDATVNAGWLAQVRWLLGRRDEAVTTLRRALSELGEDPPAPVEVALRADLARWLARTGQVGEAGDHLARCERLLADGEDWRGRAGHVDLARAAVSSSSGRPDEAASALAAALRSFTHHRLLWWELDALVARAGLERTEGGDDLGAGGDGTRRREAHRLAHELGAAGAWRDLLTAAG